MAQRIYHISGNVFYIRPHLRYDVIPATLLLLAAYAMAIYFFIHDDKPLGGCVLLLGLFTIIYLLYQRANLVNFRKQITGDGNFIKVNARRVARTDCGYVYLTSEIATRFGPTYYGIKIMTRKLAMRDVWIASKLDKEAAVDLGKSLATFLGLNYEHSDI